MTEPTSPPKFRRRADVRPAEIVAAALDEFAERGFAATRLDDIARRAGITRGTILLYYPTKEAVLEAVIDAEQARTLVEMERLVRAQRPPYGAALEAVAEGWRVNVYEAGVPARIRIVVAESANFPHLARVLHERIISRVQRMLRGLIEAGIESGEFREVDVDMAVRLLMGSLMHVADWNFGLGKASGDLIDVRRFLAAWVEMARRLLLAEVRR